jgi:hypothetical protein
MSAICAAAGYGPVFKKGTLKGTGARRVITRPAPHPENKNNDRSELGTNPETWSSVTRTHPRSDEHPDLKSRNGL